jgi:ribose 5-phosphate isomerase B
LNEPAIVSAGPAEFINESKVMRIAIGNDHRGVDAKSKLAQLLEKLGHTPVDLGACNDQSVDYPDIAAKVAHEIADGKSDRGILICGTGIGMQIAANKVQKIRAACADNVRIAELIRRHNNTNVLCLAADFVEGDSPDADRQRDSFDAVVKTWLETPFDGGRHERRVEKITQLENEVCPPQ